MEVRERHEQELPDLRAAAGPVALKHIASSCKRVAAALRHAAPLAATVLIL